MDRREYRHAHPIRLATGSLAGLRRRDACAGTHRAAATNETVTVGHEKLPGRLRRQGEEIDLYTRAAVAYRQVGNAPISYIM